MPREFRYPVEPSPKVAVYEVSAHFSPEALDAATVALPASMLRRAVASRWIPSHAIVVFTGAAYGQLQEADRDLVWDRWGVPVFEYRVNEAGEIYAVECEAHEGLHLNSPAPWEGQVIGARCPCGVNTPRIPGED